MQQLKILNTKEVKEITGLLKEEFGFEEKLNYVFLLNNRDRIYIINKDMTRINLENLRIDSMGLYFGELKNKTLRLSIEGSQIIGRGAKKNLIELDEKEMHEWLKGENLHKKMEKSAFVILKHKDDILGCGRYKEGKIFNYVPKERRLRVVSN